MKRAIRSVLTLIAALVVALLVTAGAMIQTSRSSLTREYHAFGVQLVMPTEPAQLEEGHRLYRIYGCVSCHLEDGGGRIVIPNGLGFIAAPDITLVANTLPIPDYDIVVRHGLRPNGTPLLLMPSHDYWFLDDPSTALIIGYTRSLPVAGRAYDPSTLSMLGHIIHALDLAPLVPAEKIQHGARRGPMGDPGTIERGRVLGRLCLGCHGEHLSGGVIPGADPAQLGVPRNLTSDESGLAHWTEDQFDAAMRTGVVPTGAPLNNTWMPWQDCYQYFTDDELHSIWLFLQEQPPMAFGNR